MSAIETLKIPERKDGMLKEYIYTDVKYMLVPDVLGMSKTEATKTLKDFKVKYTGSGDKVVYMSPNANSVQSVDTTITLMLN